VTRDERESDVLVIGAGPAGAAAAALLARQGVDVALLDRARFPRDKTCGDAISGAGLALLDEIGAGDAVRNGPHATVRHGAALFPDGAHVVRSYADHGMIVPRLQLDDTVRATAQEAGATLHEGVRVERLLCEGARVVGAETASTRWRAKLVIAADGYGSVALPVLGVQTPRGRHLGVSSTLYARGTRHPLGEDVAEHFFEHDLPYGYAWLFPDVDGVANLGVYLTAEGYALTGRSLNELLQRFIARHPERFSSMTPVGKVRTWSLPLAPAPMAVSAPGLLLIGDAGHYVDPFTGEGIWQALFTARAAAQVTLEALRRPSGLDEELRARFARECEAAIGRPSRTKSRIQRAMRWLVAGHAYRLPPVRAGFRWAYVSRSFGMTKA
jgi:geranylgeranyl reductase family protein